MGIDYAIGRAEQAIMLDPRSKSFSNSNPRWLLNEAPEQQYIMMNSVNAFDDRGSPLGVTPVDAMFGNYSESHPLSPTFSTDAFSDPHGPILDNGNGTCQSPGLESVYSSRTNMGTPNSYVADFQFGSPRERLLSTSSSTYAYSPYNTYEERASTPCIQRQASLEMVEQYFNNSPCGGSCAEDTGILDTSSQGFNAHFFASTELAQQNAVDPTAQNADYLINIMNDCAIPGIVMTAGSPRGSTQTSSSNNDGSNTTTATNNSPSQVFVTTTPQNTVTPCSNTQLQLPRQLSSLSDIISETIPTSSQDAPMVEDRVNSFMQNTSFGTLDTTVLEICENPYPSDENCQNTTTNNTPCNAQPEEDIVTARRERNNAACRASRKRRKDKKTEMEQSIGAYESDNKSLRLQIENLEVECKRMKQEIFARMGTVAR